MSRWGLGATHCNSPRSRMSDDDNIRVHAHHGHSVCNEDHSWFIWRQCTNAIREEWNLPARVSPLEVEEVPLSKLSTVPPRRCIAALKEQLVLVETSKNMEARTLPWKTGMGHWQEQEFTECHWAQCSRVICICTKRVMSILWGYSPEDDLLGLLSGNYEPGWRGGATVPCWTF